MQKEDINIIILGTLPNNKAMSDLYETMIDLVSQYTKNKVYSPIDTKAFSGSVRERYDRACKVISSADLIVGELSNPSTGQGIEIGHADRLNKTIIIVAKEGSKISGLVKGCPAVKEIAEYTDLQDLSSKLDSTIMKVLNLRLK